MRRFTRVVLVLAVIAITLSLTGCRRPFHTADLQEISPSQTAYLTPLEGQTSNQKLFDSEKFLDEHKVATKRIEIPYRWLPTGYEYLWMPRGKWIPTMRLIIVERKPVTREWTENPATGTTSKNEGVGAETKESIGFMARINCSAQIMVNDASRFLYLYNGKPLEDVMDQDIRPRIESRFVEQAALYSLSEDRNTGLLMNKSRIMEKVRADVIPFFKDRGVTITVLGLKGELTYLDPEVQKAINQRFISKQQRQKADNDAYVAAKLKGGGLAYQLKLQDMEIRRTLAQAQLTVAQGMAAGKIQMPLALGVNGVIGGVDLNRFGIPAQTSAPEPTTTTEGE